MLADYGKLHVSSADCTVLRPDGVDAATQGWRTALAEGRALRVRGSGHGLSGATLPRKGETLLCTRGLDHYRIEAPGLITVGGGAILWDVRDFVAARGWRLPVYNGGWAGPTVGGFASAGGLGLRVPVGEHGKPTAPQALDPVSLSERHGGFWAQAVKLTIIDGRGRVHDILPGDEDFPWMFASMGQFGLILEATLRLVPQPGVDDALPVGSSGRIPVSNPFDPNESDAAAPAQGVDWTYWFTAFAPVDEEDAVWQAIGDWSRAHRDALRPTGGWIGPLQDDHPIGFRYLVRRKAPTPPLLYPRDEDFLTLGVMAVCAGGRDRRGRCGAGGGRAGFRRTDRRQGLGALLPGGEPDPIGRLPKLLGGGALAALLRAEGQVRPRRADQRGRGAWGRGAVADAGRPDAPDPRGVSPRRGDRGPGREPGARAPPGTGGEARG